MKQVHEYLINLGFTCYVTHEKSNTYQKQDFKEDTQIHIELVDDKFHRLQFWYKDSCLIDTFSILKFGEVIYYTQENFVLGWRDFDDVEHISLDFINEILNKIWDLQNN